MFNRCGIAARPKDAAVPDWHRGDLAERLGAQLRIGCRQRIGVNLKHNPPPNLVPPSTPQTQPSFDETLDRYKAVVENPKYRHFTRIPDRIVRCLDHFQLSFDREAVRERLLAHYFFIAVVDEAIDTGQPRVAEIIFECLDRPASDEDETSSTSDVLLVTTVLKHHIENDTYAELLDRLRQAYQEVCAERGAESINDYIAHRKALGRLTAEQSYLLVRSVLDEANEELCRLMQDVGAVGCLVDSVIDLRHDSRRGLLNFQPTLFDYVTLWSRTVLAGLLVWIKKPSLSLLFVEAVIDNILDRESVRASRIWERGHPCPHAMQ